MINERGHIDDNGFVSQYWYDADGERTVKTFGDGTVVYVNSLFSGGNTQTAKFILYVSPYLVASQGGKYTKHIYVGSQRIVSKLGDLQSYGADPRRIPYAGSESDNINVDYKGKYTSQQQSIKNNYTAFDVPYNGKDNDDYVDGDGFCCDDIGQGTATRSLNPGQNDNYEQAQFYYHPDHLGSSSFITNLDGDVTQHIEYVPFGEVFFEERNNVWNTPYLFNAKELDEETELYYYGARYYDSRVSLWLSTDPLELEYPNISSYIYTFNNPVKFIDPTGMSGEDPPTQNWLIPQFQKGQYGRNILANGVTFLNNVSADILNTAVSIVNAPIDVGQTLYKRGFAGVGEEINASINAIGNSFKSEYDYITTTPAKQQFNDFVNGFKDPALWESSVAFGVTLFVGGGAKNVGSKGAVKAAKGSTNLLKPLGLGSTGRTTAANLTEQLAMKEIMSNPSAGQIIKKSLSDPRWRGWSKMTNKTAHGVEIHYNALWKNGKIISIDDFIFITP